MGLPGRVIATFLRGRATVLDGAVVDGTGADGKTLEGAAR